MTRPHIAIISPASANSNNGNWHTAHRWSRFLRSRYRVTLLTETPALAGITAHLLIALHARRSASALAAFGASRPDMPTLLVLTGTDLYRDLDSDAAARHSVQAATHLVVLQDAALKRLDMDARAKASVIYQSAPTLKPLDHLRPGRRHFDVSMIGHLRPEKDPLTFMRAATLVSSPDIRFTHVGAALDPELGQCARQMHQTQPNYCWLGGLAHAAARQRLKCSQLMVIASVMEGGANVICEAVSSGVPVAASDIDGNRGMLGDDYDGYFPLGDSGALARLIERAAAEPWFYQTLRRQCAARAPLFAPEREQSLLLQLVD
ncbi:MAG TPA: selenoneine biosynthesis selenosugar synthase SenB, partial [Burkholderiaceae bacterium]|nr:selenoneine biosynthesis selenosugar synthase SenB [Burkholderiaceae bacterium]